MLEPIVFRAAFKNWPRIEQPVPSKQILPHYGPCQGALGVFLPLRKFSVAPKHGDLRIADARGSESLKRSSHETILGLKKQQ